MISHIVRGHKCHDRATLLPSPGCGLAAGDFIMTAILILAVLFATGLGAIVFAAGRDDRTTKRLTADKREELRGYLLEGRDWRGFANYINSHQAPRAV